MEAIVQALARTEWLVGAAVAVVILGLVGLIALYKPYVIPIKTHQEQLDAERARADRAEENCAAELVRERTALAERMGMFKDDHNVRMDQAQKLFDLMLSEARRYADDWKATAHIESENAKASEDRMDEVLEAVRLMTSVVQALQHAAQMHAPAQLPPGS